MLIVYRSGGNLSFNNRPWHQVLWGSPTFPEIYTWMGFQFNINSMASNVLLTTQTHVSWVEHIVKQQGYELPSLDSWIFRIISIMFKFDFVPIWISFKVYVKKIGTGPIILDADSIPSTADPTGATASHMFSIMRKTAMGTVPLIINPIYTFYSGYLLGISPF